MQNVKEKREEKKFISEEVFNERTVHGKLTGRSYQVTTWNINGNRRMFVKWLK